MSRNITSKGKRLSLPLVVGIILIAASVIAVGIGWYARRAAGPRPAAVPAVTVHHKIPSAPAEPAEPAESENEPAALDQPAVGAADMPPLPDTVAGAEDASVPVAETAVAEAADAEGTDAQGAPAKEGQSGLAETPSQPIPSQALQEPVSSPVDTGGSSTAITGSTGSPSPVTDKQDDMVLGGPTSADTSPTEAATPEPPAAEEPPQPPAEAKAAVSAASPDTSATATSAAGIPDTDPLSADTPAAVPPGQDYMYVLQVGAYQSKANAERKSGQMRKGGYEAFISETHSSSSVILYMVRFGRFADKAQAREALARFKQQEDMSAIIVRMDRF